MKISRAKARSRLSALKPQGSPSIRFVKQMEGGRLFAFRQGDTALLTTADDSLPAIIGECSAADLDNIPPAMSAWLQAAAYEVSAFQSSPIKARAKATTLPSAAAAQISGDSAQISGDTAKPSGRVSTPPLINATWGQGAPFNANLRIKGEECLVGCNAVAVAQALYYYGIQGWHAKTYHRGCTATPKYKSGSAQIEPLPPLTVFDYANLTPGKPATAASKAAVAKMCEYLAKSFKSVFGTKVTTAILETVAKTLKSSLKMDICTVIRASKGWEAFEGMIYKKITEGCPVIMAGWTETGGGHTFLCDGYDAARDMYHFNWGWGGSCNGWFALTSLTPSAARAYNSNKKALIFCPAYQLGDVNNDGEVNITDAMSVMEAAANGSTDPKYDINSDGEVTIKDADLIVGHVMSGNKL